MTWLAKAGVVVVALVGVSLGVQSCEHHAAMTCLVTSQGAKLCGDDAKAWCNATDEFRALDPTDPAVAATQRNCDQLRGR